MELSAHPVDRGRRALDAAHLKELAGAPESVTRLLSIAESGPLDAESRARAERLRGRGAFRAVNRAAEAADDLLRAAQDLEPFDPDAARETYLEALSAALFATHSPAGASPGDIAKGHPQSHHRPVGQHRRGRLVVRRNRMAGQRRRREEPRSSTDPGHRGSQHSRSGSPCS